RPPGPVRVRGSIRRQLGPEGAGNGPERLVDGSNRSPRGGRTRGMVCTALGAADALDAATGWSWSIHCQPTGELTPPRSVNHQGNGGNLRGGGRIRPRINGWINGRLRGRPVNGVN